MAQVALISAHAASGVIAFVAGCVALRRRPAVALYLWSLVALVGFVVAAIAVDWVSLEAASRIVFLGLIALGVFMVWRAMRASRLPVSAAYIDHVGFGLIALFEGFVIVLTLDLGAPVWVVVLVALAGLVGGHVTIERAKRRMSVPASDALDSMPVA